MNVNKNYAKHNFQASALLMPVIWFAGLVNLSELPLYDTIEHQSVVWNAGDITDMLSD
jgi:hypothetical protein